MALFSYFDLKQLFTCLLELFVEAELIDNHKTFDLTNIDLDKNINFHEPKNMTLGFASEKTLKGFKKMMLLKILTLNSFHYIVEPSQHK